MMLELPLKIITPHFPGGIEVRQAAKESCGGRKHSRSLRQPASNRWLPAAQRTPSRHFASRRARAAASAAASRRLQTVGHQLFHPHSQWRSQPEEAAPPVKKGPSPGTAFLQRYATPNEIVSKAAALPGVDGALIALPDGLLVASQHSRRA